MTSLKPFNNPFVAIKSLVENRHLPRAGTLFSFCICLIILMQLFVAGQIVMGSPSGNSVYYPSTIIPPCESQIYCYGKFLDSNYVTRIFKSDKEFLHLRLKQDPGTISRYYDQTFLTNATSLDARYKKFIELFFEKIPQSVQECQDTDRKVTVSDDMILWSPQDWNPKPNFIFNIRDPELRGWATKLHNEWPLLARKISPHVKNEQDRHSLLFMKNGFILPSSRASEMLYFDNYFIIRAILLAGMNETARGIILNLLELMNKNYRFGMVPYSNRIYHQGYNAMPLIVPMIYEYWKATNDTNFAISALEQLKSDMAYWTRRDKSLHLNQGGRIRTLYHYKVFVNTPRPFAYSEDLNIRNHAYGNVSELYVNLGSMTESMWDRSSRWISNGGSLDWLRDVKTTDIIPVDLNAILCWNDLILAKIYQWAGTEATHTRQYRERLKAITALWDDDQGSWFDMNRTTRASTKRWYASNLMPLFTRCYGDGYGDGNIDIETRVLEYFKREKLDSYISGVPLSMLRSGWEWDMPHTNPFAMLTIIEGFEGSQVPEAKELAFHLAQNWLRAVRKSDENKQDIHAMTNAVTLILLDKYGERLSSTGHLSSSVSLQQSMLLMILTTNILIIFFSSI